jgi:hypothetical protein
MHKHICNRLGQLQLSNGAVRRVTRSYTLTQLRLSGACHQAAVCWSHAEHATARQTAGMVLSVLSVCHGASHGCILLGCLGRLECPCWSWPAAGGCGCRCRSGRAPGCRARRLQHPHTALQDALQAPVHLQRGAAGCMVVCAVRHPIVHELRSGTPVHKRTPRGSSAPWPAAGRVSGARHPARTHRRLLLLCRCRSSPSCQPAQPRRPGHRLARSRRLLLLLRRHCCAPHGPTQSPVARQSRHCARHAARRGSGRSCTVAPQRCGGCLCLQPPLQAAAHATAQAAPHPPPC